MTNPIAYLINSTRLLCVTCRQATSTQGINRSSPVLASRTAYRCSCYDTPIAVNYVKPVRKRGKRVK